MTTGNQKYFRKWVTRGGRAFLAWATANSGRAYMARELRRDGSLTPSVIVSTSEVEEIQLNSNNAVLLQDGNVYADIEVGEGFVKNKLTQQVFELQPDNCWIGSSSGLKMTRPPRVMLIPKLGVKSPATESVVKPEPLTVSPSFNWRLSDSLLTRIAQQRGYAFARRLDDLASTAKSLDELLLAVLDNEPVRAQPQPQQQRPKLTVQVIDQRPNKRMAVPEDLRNEVIAFLLSQRKQNPSGELRSLYETTAKRFGISDRTVKRWFYKQGLHKV